MPNAPSLSMPRAAALALAIAAPASAQDQPLPPIPMTPALTVEGPSEANNYTPWGTGFFAGDTLVVPMIDMPTGRSEGRLFDLGTGAQTGTLLPPSGNPEGFFAEGVASSARYVAMQTKVTRKGYLHNVVHVYALPELELIHTLDAPPGEDRLRFGVGDLAISGDRLAITSAAEFGGGASGTLFMYDLTSGEELYRIQDPEAPSGLLSIFQSYEDTFPGSVALTDTHLAVSAINLATNAGRVHLFDPETGAPIRQVAKPAELGSGGFGLSLALDDARLFVGASQRTNVRILLSTYAQVGEIYALNLADDALLYKLDDPMPVADGTETAAYAAATGGPVPFYGSKFGHGVQLEAGRLYANMSDFAQPVSGAGAAAVYDAQTGAPIGLIQSAQPAAESNFGVFDVLPDGTVLGFSRAYSQPNQPTKVEVLTPN